MPKESINKKELMLTLQRYLPILSRRAGYTAKDLAERIGVGDRFICNIMKGRQAMNWKVFLPLVLVLSMDEDVKAMMAIVGIYDDKLKGYLHGKKS